MNPSRIFRTLAVVATAVACLVVPTRPVEAAVHEATILDGIVTVYGTGSVPQDTYDLAPYSPLCHPDGVFELDVTGTGTIGVSALDSRTVVSYLGLTGTYLRIVTRIATGSTYGTLTGTGPYTVSDMRVGVRVVYTGSYDETTCENTGLAMCDVTFVLELDGTLTTTTVGATASLTGASVGTVAEGDWCIEPFDELVGSTVALSTPITAVFTD